MALMQLMFSPNNVVAQDWLLDQITPMLSWLVFLGKACIEEFEDQNHSH